VLCAVTLWRLAKPAEALFLTKIIKTLAVQFAAKVACRLVNEVSRWASSWKLETCWKVYPFFLPWPLLKGLSVFFALTFRTSENNYGVINRWLGLNPRYVCIGSKELTFRKQTCYLLRWGGAMCLKSTVLFWIAIVTVLTTSYSEIPKKELIFRFVVFVANSSNLSANHPVWLKGMTTKIFQKNVNIPLTW